MTGLQLASPARIAPVAPGRGRWVALLADAGEDASDFGVAPSAIRLTPATRGRTLRLLRPESGELPQYAARGERAVVFDGILQTHAELLAALGVAGRTELSAAEVLLAAYERWREEFLPKLRGNFALVIWDGARQRLLAVRDPMGLYPLFSASHAGVVAVSTSSEAVSRFGGGRGALDRISLGQRLCSRWGELERTVFEGVRRVPSGHVLRVSPSEQTVSRYWDPAPNGNIEWVEGDALERFESAFDTAVGRCLDHGRAGIFLSGGLDSVSIAAVAADMSRDRGMSPPVALSLAFPDPICDETKIQRSVADQLGMPQVLLPFDEAAGTDGLLLGTFELTRRLPAPLFNIWLPAYQSLAAEGRSRGVSSILTGMGGDQWLGVSPSLAADLLLQLDFARIWRLWQIFQHAYAMPTSRIVPSFLWPYAARPIVKAVGERAARRFAPGLLRARRDGYVTRSTPDWVAPDPDLHRELAVEGERHLPVPPEGKFYEHQLRSAFRLVLEQVHAEEDYEFSRLIGMRKFAPYRDADLIDVLFRTPPEVLNRGGRHKGMVRQSLARRFPTLGFERQAKVSAIEFSSSLMRNQWSKSWKWVGGVPTLERLGLVDSAKFKAWAEAKLAQPGWVGLYQIWDALNLEVWARDRS